MKGMSLTAVGFLLLSGYLQAQPAEEITEFELAQSAPMAMPPTLPSEGESLAIIHHLENTGFHAYNAVAFANENDGVIVGGAGLRVRVTHDGGAHWQEMRFSRFASTFYSAVVADGKFLVVGESPYIFSSSDGLDWRMYDTRPLFDPTMEGTEYVQIRFFNASLGAVVGRVNVTRDSKPALLLTSDGGVQWRAQTTHGLSQEVQMIMDIDLISEHDWIIVTSNGEVYRTANAGESWQRILALEATGLNAIAFQDSEHGCVGGINGQLWCTQNGGADWQQIALPEEKQDANVSTLTNVDGEPYLTLAADYGDPSAQGCLYRIAGESVQPVLPQARSDTAYFGECYGFDRVGDMLYVLDRDNLYRLTLPQSE